MASQPSNQTLSPFKTFRSCLGNPGEVLPIPLLALMSLPPASTYYDLNVRVVPDQRLVTVQGTAVLPASNKPTSKIGFQLMDQMRDLRCELLEPRQWAGPLKPASLGNLNKHENYVVQLPTPVPADTPIKLGFSYQGGDKTAFVFHVGPEGSYGCGSTSAWYPEFGPQDDKAIRGQSSITAQIKLTVPTDLTAIATGAETGPVVSGSEKTYTYAMKDPAAASFSVAKYKVLKSPGDLPVSLYTLSDRKDSEEMVRGIRAVVDKLVELYGPFPFPSFSLVEVSEESIKGAGFDGAGCAGFMLSGTAALSKGFNMAFFGHEIGHQWWGNMVTHGPEPEGKALLDEAMAQYGSLRCVHDLLGEEMAEQYRRDRFPGYSSTQSGGYYLAMSLAGFDKKLAELGDGDLLSHELADEKGFMVYEMLRQEIGDEAFHAALKQVASKYAFREVTWRQFKAEVERSAGRKLGWFWDQWFERLGAPFLDLKWSQDNDQVKGTILQEDPAYRLGVPIAIRYADGGSEIFRVSVKGASTPFARTVKGQVSEVLIDPHFETLHYTPELKAWAQSRVEEVKAKWTPRLKR